MEKLLIYIVSFQRKSYTQGTIQCIHKVKPPNSQIIVCDNGSTDGTREWLQENQEKYDLGLLFPEKNLRVPGAWKLITNYFTPEEFDYILPMDNDNWMTPNITWYTQCLNIFNSNHQIKSLGIQKERKPGYFSMGKSFDPSYNTQSNFGNINYYDTVFYAGARIDKFNIFHQIMNTWSSKFIGDKLNRYYNSLGFRTLKITPGFIVDISEYNFDNKSHTKYNIDFYQRERDDIEFARRMDEASTSQNELDYVKSTFGKEYLKYIT